jgi:hypothetical protein
MVSAQVVGVGEAVGSALLAFWIIARYPARGPQSVRSSTVACALSLLLLQLVAPALRWATAATDSATALLVVVVPVFVWTFWSAGALVRAAGLRLR